MNLKVVHKVFVHEIITHENDGMAIKVVLGSCVEALKLLVLNNVRNAR